MNVKSWRWMVAVGLLLVAAGTVRADVSAGGPVGSGLAQLSSYVCQTSGGCNAALPAGTLVKGMKLLSGAALGHCALYDAATVPLTVNAGLSAPPVEELYEATAGDTNLHMFPGAIRFATGVSIAMTGATTVCIVYY